MPEVIDAWFDSGAMPFAQFHYPFENEELFEQRFPADFICEALDQTRGWFYSLLAESTLLFGSAELQERALPGPDPRPRRPEDVEEPRQRGRAVGRDRPPRRGRVSLVLLHLPAAVVGIPLLGRDGRRERAQVPADAVEHVQLLRPVRERRRSSTTSAGRRSSRGPRPALDRWVALAPAEHDRGGARRARRLRHDVGRPLDRDLRRRSLELVRAPHRAGASGGAASESEAGQRRRLPDPARVRS